MDVHKMFASEQMARQFLDNVAPPSGQDNVVVIAPLSDVSVEPDLVLAVCNADQANRIVSLLMYSGLRPFTYNLVSAGCTSLSHSMVTGEIDINFITGHARRRVRNFAGHELILTMPLERFKEVVANIPYAGAGRRG